jgi:uncharacterized membrane protein
MPMPKQPENPTQSFVDANIDAIIGAEQTVHRARSPSEVVYGWVGGFIGTLTFVVVQVLCVVLWVAINAGLATSIRPFDLFPFPVLSLILTLEALLVAAFVLMKQNSMSKLADRRSHLDLQINLMTERETTKIIRMLLAARHSAQGARRGKPLAQPASGHRDPDRDHEKQVPRRMMIGKRRNSRSHENNALTFARIFCIT